MPFDRRGFLALAASGLAATGLPGRARAASPSRRRFLFVHCYGGWDTTYVFQPNFGAAGVDMEVAATAAEVAGIRFVDAASRPSVRSFLERYGSRTCVINGVEVPSITHERCSRIMLTGRADADADDWGATLAGTDPSPTLLPYLVLSGTAFTARYASKVVRVGNNGQLEDLLSGAALDQIEPPIAPPSDATRSRVDAWLADRAGGLAATSPMARGFAAAHADQMALEAAAADLHLGGVASGCTRFIADATTALDAFEAGLTRTALVQYTGWCGVGWDTHVNNVGQDRNFSELFEFLARVVADLDTRASPDGGPLADEVVMIVLSEMGRTPKIAAGGRNHWPFTSTMLFGAGVRGGQVIGGYDEYGVGVGTDLDSGAVSDSSATLHASNVGATILALGDVDPGAFQPITAAIR